MAFGSEGPHLNGISTSSVLLLFCIFFIILLDDAAPAACPNHIWSTAALANH
jgi:hypothetical protein